MNKFLITIVTGLALATAAQGAGFRANPTGPSTGAPGGIAYAPTPHCASGFAKVKLTFAQGLWSQLVCQTPIIECPASTKPVVVFDPEIVSIGGGDQTSKYRFKYTCTTYTPEG